MIVIEIATENAAFEGAGRSEEVARILRELAVRVEEGALYNRVTRIADINGNRVGKMINVINEKER